MQKINFSKLVKAVVSALILIYLFTLIDLSLLETTIRRANLTFVGLVLVMIAVNLLITSYRWLLVVNKDRKHLRFRDAVSVCLVGTTLNMFMPASSGDLAKAYYGYQWFGLKEEMLSASFVDKLAGALSLFVIATVSALALRFYAISALFCILAAFAAVLFLIPRTIPWNMLNRLILRFSTRGLDVQTLLAASRLNNPLRIALLAISTLAWAIGFTELYFAYNIFSNKVLFPYVMIIGPVTNLAYLFPLTLNGLGSGDAVLVFALGYLGITATVGVMTAFLHRVLALAPALVGWALILVKKGKTISAGRDPHVT